MFVCSKYSLYALTVRIMWVSIQEKLMTHLSQKAAQINELNEKKKYKQFIPQLTTWMGCTWTQRLQSAYSFHNYSLNFYIHIFMVKTHLHWNLPNKAHWNVLNIYSMMRLTSIYRDWKNKWSCLLIDIKRITLNTDVSNSTLIYLIRIVCIAQEKGVLYKEFLTCC